MQLAVKMSVKTCDAACDKDVGEDNGKLIMERKIKAGLWSSALVLQVWKLFARIYVWRCWLSSSFPYPVNRVEDGSGSVNSGDNFIYRIVCVM